MCGSPYRPPADMQAGETIPEYNSRKVKTNEINNATIAHNQGVADSFANRKLKQKSTFLTTGSFDSQNSTNSKTLLGQ